LRKRAICRCLFYAYYSIDIAKEAAIFVWIFALSPTDNRPLNQPTPTPYSPPPTAHFWKIPTAGSVLKMKHELLIELTSRCPFVFGSENEQQG